MSSTIIVSIDGNIGSGKSTLETELIKRFGVPVIHVKEPVEEWGNIKDKSGNTMLQLFYKDPLKYGFSFQIMAYISRLKLLKAAIKENPGAIIITERSLYTDKLVFAKMLYDTGKMEDVNYQIYLNWFDAFIEECGVNKIIYIKASPETCYNRIALRARSGEEQIPIQYLTECDIYHDEMLKELSHIPQLVLDGNSDINTNPNKLDDWISQIRDFILE